MEYGVITMIPRKTFWKDVEDQNIETYTKLCNFKI